MKKGNAVKFKLLRSLFDSIGFGHIISTDDPKTVKNHNNIVIILLVIFMPWNRL